MKDSGRHWNWLYSSFVADDYVRKNFAFRDISEKECCLWNSKNSLFFVVKRTSENNYIVGCVCYFRVNFESFRKAGLVIQHIKDMSYCVDVLQAYKSTGIEFDLSTFTWNLLGFNELITGVPIVSKKQPVEQRQETQSELNFKRNVYFESKFNKKRKW